MRCYLAVTGVVFALIFAAQVARLWAEGAWLLREPFFIGTSVAALGLSVWAAMLWIRGRQ